MRKSAILILIFIINMPLFSDPVSGWKKINTEHFEILFRESDRTEAFQVAGFSEEVYAKVTGFFKSYPEKITCIIHGEIDTANGYFSPLPPSISLYTTAPSVPLISALNGNWLKLLLTHELTHYVNLTMDKGLFHKLSGIFGKGFSSIPAGFIPLWAIEGIAVKLETDLTEGGRGRNPFFEMEYKSEILDNSFYSWKQASYPSAFPPYDRIYQAGYLLNDYLSRTYGNDIFVRIYTNYLANPFFGFNHAVKKCTGSSVKDIFSSMKDDLQKKYSTSSRISGKQISPEIISDYFIPRRTDRGWILYRRTMGKEPAIVVYNRKTNNETVLIKTSLTDFTSFSTDKSGNTVVFSAFTFNGKNPSLNTLTSDLFVYSAESGKTVRITRGKHLYHPALSADGKKLAAVQKNGQYSRLVEINADTGEVSPLFSMEETSVYNPSYSPDGSRLVFTMNIKGKQNIYILTTEGECLNLTEEMKGSKYFPLFEKNNSVIFSADTEDSLILYRAIMKNNGKTAEISKICTDTIAAYAGFTDGGDIIYGSYSSGGYCIKKQPVETQEIVSGRTLITPQKPISGNTAVLPESSHTDLPEFMFWLPTPFSMDPFESSIDPAPGAVSYFISPLGNNTVNLSLSVLTDPVQPEGTVSFTHKGKRMIFDYSLKEGYSNAEEGFASLEILQNLFLTVPLIENNIFNTNRYLIGYTGGIYDFRVQSPSDFQFPFPRGGLYSTKNRFYLNTGIGTGIRKNGSTKDIFPPFELAFSQMFYFPVKEGFTAPLWRGNAVFGFPSFIKHHTVRISGRWGFEGNDSLSLTPSIRGFSNTADTEGVIVLAADYLFSIGITDIPVSGGFSIQGFAGGIHMEKTAGFSFIDPDFKTEDYLYPGLELNLTAGYLGVIIRGGLGISSRVDPLHPGNFNPAEDIGVYIYIGTDSTRNQIF